MIRIVVSNPEQTIRHYLAVSTDFPLFHMHRECAKTIYGYDLTLFESMKGNFISMN